MTMLLRSTVKLASVASALTSMGRLCGLFFLTYHKVDGASGLELDIAAAQFRRQMAYLAQRMKVVSLDQALSFLDAGLPLTDDLYVLTFDDGFRDFYTQAFPILQQHGLPAVLYVNTGFVETGITYPLEPIGRRDVPVTWGMLAEMADSGLVTLGAHTHTHPLLVDQPDDRIEEELGLPIDLIRRRTGMVARHFAYPLAVWDTRTEDLVKRYYASAAIGTGQIAYPGQVDPYRIPRISIRRSDSWRFFQAKVHGLMEREEVIYSRLKHPALVNMYKRLLLRGADG